MINLSPTITSSVFGLQAVKRLSRHKRKRKNPLLHLFHGPLDILPAISLLSLLNPQTKHTRALWLYGKVQRVRIRSVIAVARFLRGVPVRAVWCEMRQPDGTWSRPRLILATETDLTAQDVVEIYATRWGIEPLFHNLKRWWGVTNLWQPSKEALELWMQIRCTAYALMQMLALKLVDLLSFDGDCALAQGCSDHGRSFRPVDANSIYRTSRKKCLRPEVGEFRDAVSGSGSAFAVLTPVASRQSA